MLLLLGSALSSCFDKGRRKLVSDKSYRFVIDEIIENKGAIKLLDIDIIEDSLSVFFLNKADSSLNFVWVRDDSSTKQDKFYVKNILTKSIVYPSSKWLIVNYDTLFAIDKTGERVYLFNVNDIILDSFLLNPNNSMGNLTCFSSDFGKMKYANRKLFVPVSAEVVFDSSSMSYEAISGLILDLYSGAVDKFSRKSKSKILQPYSFSNPYDYFDVTKNQVFFSSEEDSFIYSYNYQQHLYKKYLAKSSFFKIVNPFPDSLRFNREARIEYIAQEPRFSRIGVCCEGRYIIRVAKHKSVIPKSTGFYKAELPRSNYSLILLDTNGILVDEIRIDTHYASGFMIPTQGGVILLNTETDLKNKGLLCLDVLEIK